MALSAHQPRQVSLNDWLCPKTVSPIVAMMALNRALSPAAKPSSPTNSLSVFSVRLPAMNRRTSHAAVMASTVPAPAKKKIKRNFVPCNRSKVKFATMAASTRPGHARYSFNSSAPTYNPAGSQKVTKEVDLTERKLLNSAQAK